MKGVREPAAEIFFFQNQNSPASPVRIITMNHHHHHHHYDEGQNRKIPTECYLSLCYAGGCVPLPAPPADSYINHVLVSLPYCGRGDDGVGIHACLISFVFSYFSYFRVYVSHPESAEKKISLVTQFLWTSITATVVQWDGGVSRPSRFQVLIMSALMTDGYSYPKSSLMFACQIIDVRSIIGFHLNLIDRSSFQGESISLAMKTMFHLFQSRAKRASSLWFTIQYRLQ